MYVYRHKVKYAYEFLIFPLSVLADFSDICINKN